MAVITLLQVRKLIFSLNFLDERSNVIIFDSIYYDSLYYFDGHTSLIRDIVITEDDRKIITTCDAGYVYLWNMDEPETNYEKDGWEHRNTLYNKILYDNANDLFFGCTPEKNICIYKNHCKEKLVEFISTDFDANAAVISQRHKTLIFGTNKGTIRVMLWPLNKEGLELEPVGNQGEVFKYKYPEFIEYTVSLSPIIKMEISPDENYLFVCSLDGTMLLMKVNFEIYVLIS